MSWLSWIPAGMAATVIAGSGAIMLAGDVLFSAAHLQREGGTGAALPDSLRSPLAIAPFPPDPSLADAAQRPLFNASRRVWVPPPSPPAQAPPPLAQPQAPPPPSPPLLVGVIVVGGERWAVLRSAVGGNIERTRPGSEFESWRVLRVEANEVEVRNEGQHHTLVLFQPVAHSTPNPPPTMSPGATPSLIIGPHQPRSQ